MYQIEIQCTIDLALDILSSGKRVEVKGFAGTGKSHQFTWALHARSLAQPARHASERGRTSQPEAFVSKGTGPVLSFARK